MTWRKCPGPECPYEIEASKACRFEDENPHKPDLLLCPVCCPNCTINRDPADIHRMMTTGVMRNPTEGTTPNV